jgi:hypothetical protein
MTDCNSNIDKFCDLRNQKYYNKVFNNYELHKITAYVKKDEKEIEVELRQNTSDGPNDRSSDEWRTKIENYDEIKKYRYDNTSYNYKDIYLKTGTEWWFKYHILSFNEECVRTHIESFDKKEMLMYAVTYGKLPEDIEESASSTTDNNENILSILPLLKPDSLNDSDNYNILFIACTRYNLKLVKFLVDNCGIKLSVHRRKSLFSSPNYLLNEIAIDYVTNDSHSDSRKLNYIKINVDKLHNFMDRLISYASEQTPVVNLVNQDVLTNAEKYRRDRIEKHKSDLRIHRLELTAKNINSISEEPDYYSISEEPNGYIHWLKKKLLSPQQSIVAKVCDALTPGCLKTRRVYAESGGSKKRAKKTRKQRKPRNSKRNHKK